MYKFKEMILMLCLFFAGALCYVHGKAITSNEKDWVLIPINITQSVGSSGWDRSNSILPTLDNHVLTVIFNENMGQVSVVVATTSGATVESLSVYTPNGVQVYIPNAGNYIVTFTFSDGDEYYGEFTVTN